MSVKKIVNTKPEAKYDPEDVTTKKETAANSTANTIDRNGDGFKWKNRSAASRKYIPMSAPDKKKTTFSTG